MFIVCPDSGIQFSPVLPKGNTDVSLASDAKIVCVLSTIFRAHFLSPLAMSKTLVRCVRRASVRICLGHNFYIHAWISK